MYSGAHKYGYKTNQGGRYVARRTEWALPLIDYPSARSQTRPNMKLTDSSTQSVGWVKYPYL